MAKWKAVYTFEQAGGITYEFECEAPNEDMAKMRLGMKRAESFVGRFTREFYAPQIVRWERLSLERIEEGESVGSN